MFKSLLMLVGLGIYEVAKFIKHKFVWVVLLAAAWATWHYRWLGGAMNWFKQCHVGQDVAVPIMLAAIGGAGIATVITLIIVVGMKSDNHGQHDNDRYY